MNTYQKKVEYILKLRSLLKKHTKIEILEQGMPEITFHNTIVDKARQYLHVPEIQMTLQEIDLLSGFTPIPIKQAGKKKVKKSSPPIFLFIFLVFTGLIVGFLLTSQFTREKSENTNSNIENENTILINNALPSDQARTVLRIHGCNILGNQLTPLLVKEYLKQNKSAIEIAEVSTIETQKYIQALLPNTPNPIAVEIFSHGSATAFRDLGNDSSDIGQSSRPITIKEQELLASYGDLSSRSGEHIIGLDAFIILVSPDNPVSEITVEELAKIFSGEYKFWHQLQYHYGKTGEIHLFTLNKSDIFNGFELMVMDNFNKSYSKDLNHYQSIEQIEKILLSDSQAIAFINASHKTKAKPLNISLSKQNVAIPADAFNIASESYPLTRRLYFYTPITNKAPNPYIIDLIKFIYSDQGQELINQAGFVSQQVISKSIYFKNDKYNAILPEKYLQKTNGATRLSSTFYFEKGKLEFDNKANYDLKNLIQFLSQQEYHNRNIMIFGFSTTQEEKNNSNKIAEQRARKLYSALSARGIFAGIEEGYSLPADNLLLEEKNRRVEIWLQ